tara:strand:+ start:765 stop:1175 length:411 start_codon:yes stop_codon:yes gene_type:complete
MTRTSNIEKIMSGGGPNTPRLDMSDFIKLADADTEKMEFDALNEVLELMKEKFENERKPGESFDSWFKRTPREEIIRISLESGGKVIKFSDYHKPKEVKKINLSDYFDLGRTLSSLSRSERDTLKWLLNKSLYPKD